MVSASNRRQAIELIQEAQSSGSRLLPACELLGLSLRTYQRWSDPEEMPVDRRPWVERLPPSHALTAEERAEILTVCHQEGYAALSPDQIVVRLMDEEQRYLASVSSFYRVLRAAGEVAHRGRSKMPQKRAAPPTTWTATAPNQVWSWDCTWLSGPVKGMYYYLILIVDIYSRKVVGSEVFIQESSEAAKEVLAQAVLSEQVIDKPLVLHSDNGSSFKGATLLEKLYDLGITPSYSRPRVSNDNAYSEALFRTVKYVPDYPTQGFGTLEAAQQWVHRFVQWYNTEHRHSAIRFVTPQQRHEGEETAILAERHRLNQEAKARHPARWSQGKTRNWGRVTAVALNPERESAMDAGWEDCGGVRPSDDPLKRSK